MKKEIALLFWIIHIYCMPPANNTATKNILSLKELSLRALLKKPRVIDRRKLERHKALLEEILFTVMDENCALKAFDADCMLYINFAGTFALDNYIQRFAYIFVDELNSSKTKIYNTQYHTIVEKRAALWKIITTLPDPIIQAIRKKCNS